MNISVQMIVIVTAACLCVAHAAPDLRGRTKQQRPTRGFKNVEMMTARGFGKRDRPIKRTERDVGDHLHPTRDSRGVPTFKSSSIGIARDFGKRSETVEDVYVPKNVPMMTAERYGKRDEDETRSRRTFKPNSKVLIARGYGKRDYIVDQSSVYGEQPEETLWETLDQPGEMDPNDSRDDKQDSFKTKTRHNDDVEKTTTEHFEREKENVKLRHTVDEKKRRKLSKSRPRSVKSMKTAKSGNKTKQEKKRKSKSIDSITVDTFTKEMIRNPDFAKTVVRRFIDRNLDGFLTEDELLKVNV